MEKETKIINWQQDFLHHRIMSAVKIVDFGSYRVSYIVLRGRWCSIIFINVHTPSEKKSDDSKDSFYEDKAGFFNHFLKYNMKILLVAFRNFAKAPKTKKLSVVSAPDCSQTVITFNPICNRLVAAHNFTAAKESGGSIISVVYSINLEYLSLLLIRLPRLFIR